MATAQRTGARVVVETLEQLGAETAFGLPGIHMLPVWDALRESSVRALHLRTELDAGFAADGCARVTGAPTPLLLSSGPGALNALTALMEAAAVHVPVVAIASQIPREFIGRQRGFLHELPDQIASFRPVVKHAVSVAREDEIAPALAAAWRIARTPPSGPVFVEIPTDLLEGPGAEAGALDGAPDVPPLPAAELLADAAARLDAARAPVIWAGGGVVRGAAWEQAVALAEALDAPVATTFMGKGAISDDHPLAVGAACNEEAVLALLADADVVLALGTQLGADTTDEYRLRFGGTLIHVDANPRQIGANYEALGLVGDCGPVLAALRQRVGRRTPGDGAARAAAVRAQVRERLARVETGPELGMVEALRAVVPTDAVDAWDSTILGYWGASYFPARRPRRFLYPLGSGTIGYGFPAALGAAAALPDAPVLAVSGDGGFQYGIAELAALRQHDLDVKLVLVDDGGYGILREYQDGRFGRRIATDLTEPDFVHVCAAFGLPVRRTSLEGFAEDVGWLFEQRGPAVVVLEAELTCYEFE